jgi:hypothetical protein
MTAGQSYFEEYEAAVDRFQRDAGGVTVTAIRSPRKLLDKFRAAFPHETHYAGGVVELAEQDHVSVLGINLARQSFEWPEPE